MIEIQDFKETYQEFIDICKIENLINHDSISHPQEMRDCWNIRNKQRYYNKLLAYKENNLVGVLHLAQGQGSNDRNFYFSMYIDPDFNKLGIRELLYNELLKRVRSFNCKALYPYVYEHPNYIDNKNFYIQKGFLHVQTNREYSLMLSTCDTSPYKTLIPKLEAEGIVIQEPIKGLNKKPDHYKKLEELQWIYEQDMPIPEGIEHTRTPFEEWMVDVKNFEEKLYGIELVAIYKNQYVASTDIELMKKSDPYKAWTGGLGVHPEFRKKGIATALKVQAIEKLRKRGVKEIRTDNEQNNPMYLINAALGFKPVPYSLDYKKNI